MCKRERGELLRKGGCPSVITPRTPANTGQLTGKSPTAQRHFHHVPFLWRVALERVNSEVAQQLRGNWFKPRAEIYHYPLVPPAAQVQGRYMDGEGEATSRDHAAAGHSVHTERAG